MSSDSLRDRLIAAGQDHLYKASSTLDSIDAQINQLNDSYSGGLVAYVEKARRLLADSRDGVNPFDGMWPEDAFGVTVDFGSQEFLDLEARGLAAAAESAFVLVAGGLGERLGYNGIKISLPVEITSGRCYLQHYVQHIQSFERCASINGSHAPIPLAIMTSDDTHEATVKLLEENGYFGLTREQVTILKQEKVAAICDNNGRIAVKDGLIQTKPHGHGDVHALLSSSGLAKTWAAAGRRYIVFFQDTNSLSFRQLVVGLGVSEREGLDGNLMTGPRVAKDAAGSIIRMRRTDGSSLTMNVEYNQLDAVLRATIQPQGDINESNGLSRFPANTNQLIFSIPTYVQILEQNGGKVPEFVNPKYADKEKTKFKKPTRLECMMQDILLQMNDIDHRVAYTLITDLTAKERPQDVSTTGWRPKASINLYCPVKNNIKDAASKAKSGNYPACASAGEAAYYAAGCRMLEIAGASVGFPLDETWGKDDCSICVPCHPQVVLEPSFAPSHGVLLNRLTCPGNIRITSNSSLVVRGEGVTIGSLDLDGALVIEAARGTKLHVDGLVVRNKGWRRSALRDEYDYPEELKIRGYEIINDEQWRTFHIISMWVLTLQIIFKVPLALFFVVQLQVLSNPTEQNEKICWQTPSLGNALAYHV
eukprot:UC4_evm2s1447